MSTSVKEGTGVASHLKVRDDRRPVLVYLSPTSENWGEYAAREVPDKSLSIKGEPQSTSASESVPANRKSFWLLPPNEQSDLSNVTYTLVKDDHGADKKRVAPFFIKDRRA
jgi:hypothetical protein